MASSSGTLFQYFKNPSSGCDKSPTLVNDEDQKVFKTKRKTKEECTDGTRKRRKLSLSALREKQYDLDSKPDVNYPIELVSEDGEDCSVNQSIKSTCRLTEKKHDGNIKDINATDSVDCRKKEIKNDAVKLTTQISNSLEICDADSENDSEFELSMPNRKNINMLSDEEEYVIEKSSTGDFSNVSKISHDFDEVRPTKSIKDVLSNHKKVSAISSYKQKCVEKSSKSKKICREKSIKGKNKKSDINVCTPQSDTTDKVSNMVKNISDDDIGSPKLNNLMGSPVDAYETECDLNISRRSGRLRKPVERFIIDSDEDHKSNKMPKTSKNIKKMKKDKDDNHEDDITFIDVKSSSRKSVSSVLGKSKQKCVVPLRPSSSTVMQEAKKLMEAKAVKNSFQVSCNKTNNTSNNQCQSYSTSVKKVGEGTIWPKISHVGLSEDIIIYPVITTQVDHYQQDAGPMKVPVGVFKKSLYKTFDPLPQKGEKRYDDCVEELSASNTNTNVEDIIELYRNCTRPSLSSNLSPEVQHSEQRLWTEIYCPSNHKHYIGNKSSVKQLHKWLDGWRVKLLNEKKKKKSRFDSWSSSDTDFVDTDGEEVRWLDNVVLLTGGSGSGKSGAISTCANQLGYKVIELNTSCERSGKNVAELLSEASQSHSVTGKSGSADFTKILADIAAKNAARKTVKRGGLDNFFGKKGEDTDKKEVIDVDDTKKPKKKKKLSKNKEKLAKNITKEAIQMVESHSKVDRMSLIVLEEIDLIFEEDRGFLAAIVALTQIARRPIILTSNDPFVALPSDAQFLVLPFDPPKIESVLLHMSCLSLSQNNYPIPYPLHQYLQFYNSNILKTLSDLEFINVSSKEEQLTEFSITDMLLGASHLNSQRVFLEQTQSLNIQYTYLNLEKLLKKRDVSETREVLEQVVFCDTFLYLDMMAPKEVPSSHFQLYPPRICAALAEEVNACTEDSDELFHDRVAAEDQLLNYLHLSSPLVAHTRLNQMKPKDSKKYRLIKEVQVGVSKALSGINLMSRSVMDEFSALRQICKSEQIKEEIGARRRFTHYLDKEIQCRDRKFLSDQWLGS